MKQCSLQPVSYPGLALKPLNFLSYIQKKNRSNTGCPGKVFKKCKKRRAAESPFKEILQLCRTVDILLYFQFHLPFSGA